MIKLLIVDDESFVRDGLRERIDWNSLGVDQVDVADDGVNALRKSDAMRPDIILTDIRMPRMDGIELAARIRTSLPGSKILFLTAYSETDYLKSAIHLHAFGYIEKPVVLQELTTTIAEAVSHLRDERRREAVLGERLAAELVGNASRPGPVSERSLFHGRAGAYTAIVALFEQGEKLLDRRGHRERLLAAVRSTAAELSLSCVFSTRDRFLYMVAFHPPSAVAHAPEVLPALAGRLLRVLRRSGNLVVGVGPTVTAPERVPRSYRCAVRAAERVFYSGYGVVHVWTGSRSASAIDASLPERWVAALNRGHLPEMVGLVEAAVRDFRAHPDTPVRDVADLLTRIVLALVQHAQTFGIDLLRAGADRIVSGLAGGTGTLEEVRGDLVELAQRFARQVGTIEGAHHIVPMLQEVISNGYADPDLTVGALCDRIRMSRNHANLVFKRETGATIHERITALRLNRARQLLRDGKLQVKEIAYRCGFRDNNYFSKAFKRAFLRSPSQYRRGPTS